MPAPEIAPDVEALAIYLESAGSCFDPEGAAAALLEEFGSLGELIAARRRRVAKVAGRKVARVIAAHSELLRRGSLERVMQRPVIANREALNGFLRQEIGFSTEEHVLALFLDMRLGVIKAETVATGTVTSCGLEAFRLFSRGKELGAAGFILAHNHPSRDPEPSRDDIALTAKLARMGADLDMPLLEHIIVAGGEFGRVPIYR